MQYISKTLLIKEIYKEVNNLNNSLKEPGLIEEEKARIENMIEGIMIIIDKTMDSVALDERMTLRELIEESKRKQVALNITSKEDLMTYLIAIDKMNITWNNGDNVAKSPLAYEKFDETQDNAGYRMCLVLNYRKPEDTFKLSYGSRVYYKESKYKLYSSNKINLNVV